MESQKILNLLYEANIRIICKDLNSKNVILIKDILIDGIQTNQDVLKY